MSAPLNQPPAAKLVEYGCSREFWCELYDIGRAMIDAGGSRDATPLRAYCHQRFAATHARGVEWHLTLPEWWAIWTESGHWTERGTGRGYQMCRNADTGPYAVGNVYIAPGAINLSAASKKELLPIGVARIKKGKMKPYRAICWVEGKQRHLGCFGTVTEARNAYLVALGHDLEARAA